MTSLICTSQVHFIPVLLTRPRTLIRPARFLATTLGTLRSTAFLASFVALHWYGVCLARTVVLARIFPFLSHDFWDGPHGAMLAGSLACGASIWIENGRRRGEMALYVLPRALRTILPGWLARNQGWKSRVVEQYVCASVSWIVLIDCSGLPSFCRCRPSSLRPFIVPTRFADYLDGH